MPKSPTAYLIVYCAVGAVLLAAGGMYTLIGAVLIASGIAIAISLRRKRQETGPPPDA